MNCKGCKWRLSETCKECRKENKENDSYRKKTIISVTRQS